MRPVNLIPPEERRGDRAPLRAGRLSYVLIGGLALVLALVTVVVLTGNQAKERETELAGLEQQEAAATARAEALRPYAEFAALTASRIATVTSLAQSRFDWERVMRELALVLPADVWLTDLSGTVGGEAAVAGTESTSTESVSAPSLTMSGCGKGHESVARLLQTLRDIDGVTRVGLRRSALPDIESEGGSSGAQASDDDCQARAFLAGFELTVAFDGVPTPAGAATAPATTAPATPSPATPGTEQAQSSVAEQTQNAEDAANLVPGVAR